MKGSSGAENGHVFCKQTVLTAGTGRLSQRSLSGGGRRCPQTRLAHDLVRDLNKGTEDLYNPSHAARTNEDPGHSEQKRPQLCGRSA